MEEQLVRRRFSCFWMWSSTHAVGGSSKGVEESTEGDDAVQLGDGDQLAAAVGVLEVLQVDDVFVEQSSKLLNQHLLLLALQPAVDVRAPAEVRVVAVDHATARHGRRRRHRQVAHLEQQRHLPPAHRPPTAVSIKQRSLESFGLWVASLPMPASVIEARELFLLLWSSRLKHSSFQPSRHYWQQRQSWQN